MLLDGIGEISEMFRNSFPLSFLFFIPIFIIISPVCHVNAAHEFSIYRMQQFDHYDTKYGTFYPIALLIDSFIGTNVI